MDIHADPISTSLDLALEVHELATTRILWGCVVPVLLRPKKKATGLHSATQDQIWLIRSDCVANNHTLPLATNLNGNFMEDFEFVGEAYVDQCMGGEAFDFVDSHNIQMQDFYIH